MAHLKKSVLNVVFFLSGDSGLLNFICRRFGTLFLGGVSRKNNRDKIVVVFIREKFWLENRLIQSVGG